MNIDRFEDTLAFIWIIQTQQYYQFFTNMRFSLNVLALASLSFASPLVDITAKGSKSSALIASVSTQNLTLCVRNRGSSMCLSSNGAQQAVHGEMDFGAVY
jgi:hypothetical protein